MRAAFLGPEGTYSHAALLADPRAAEWEPVPAPTVFDAVAAVEEGVVDLALVPIENSTEGAVGRPPAGRPGEPEDGRIVGEVVHPSRPALSAREPIELESVEVVV